MRLKDVVDIINEKTDDVDRPYVALENIVSWDAKFVASNAATEGTNACFKSGDVLFGKLRPYLAKGYLPDYDGICSTEFLVMRPHYDMNGRYLLYWLLSPDFIGVIKNRVAGVKMPRTDWATVSQMELTPPSLELQQKIVGYLDEKTAAIDARVVVLEKKLAAYKRLKTSVINEAVTGRVDLQGEMSHGDTEARSVSARPSTNSVSPCLRVRKMKDSGVDWIGKVPVGWEVEKLNYRYSVQLGKMLDTSRIKGDCLVHYLRNQDVQWGAINTDDLPEMDIPVTERDQYSVRKGDLLVCEGGEIGRAAIWQRDETCYYQKALMRLRKMHANDSSRWMYYLLVAAAARKAFENATGRSTIAHLPAEKLSAARFPFPDEVEQRAIADYLDAECAKIDKMAALVTREIELYKNLKRSLINEVVTGKRPVFADEPLPSSPAGSAETSRRGKEVA